MLSLSTELLLYGAVYIDTYRKILPPEYLHINEWNQIVNVSSLTNTQIYFTPCEHAHMHALNFIIALNCTIARCGRAEKTMKDKENLLGSGGE